MFVLCFHRARACKFFSSSSLLLLCACATPKHLYSFSIFVILVFRVQNFRLHPNEAHVNQSLDVHRINRMFNTSEANTKTKITVNNGKSTSRKEFGAAVDSVNSQSHRKSAAARDEHQKHRRRHHHHHHRSKDMTDAMNNKTASATAYITMANNNFLDKNSNRNLITMEEEEPCTAHEESFQNGNW